VIMITVQPDSGTNLQTGHSLVAHDWKDEVMQIRSTQRPPTRPVAPKSLHQDPGPQGVTLSEIAPAAGGLVLGGASAVMGHQLAKNYGYEVADTLVRKAWPLVRNGTISLECALKALPYVTDRAVQLRVGALSFGLAGFAVGAALLWPQES
jgi:hypothetical protein